MDGERGQIGWARKTRRGSGREGELRNPLRRRATGRRECGCNLTRRTNVVSPLTDNSSMVLITRTSIVVLLQYVTHRAKLCKSIARY
jgi:hypothetical protein